MLLAAWGAAPAGAAGATGGCPTGLVTYLSTNAEQCYTVPAGVTTVHVVAVGGRGGDGRPGSDGTAAPGGFGARVAADVAVRGGQILYVAVGGNGTSGSSGSANGAGGFNGGGSVTFGSGGAGTGGPNTSGGGGGASDVRTASCGTSCPGDSTSLASRLIVAAGGGGAGVDVFGAGGSFEGGAGGTPDGQSGQSGPFLLGGQGASQSAGGTGGPGGSDGALGVGGDSAFGGGGGGGLYGGGGGGFGEAPPGGGGGGSSFGPTGSAYALDTTGTPRVTISAPPVATTNVASDVTPATATLNGTVNPDGQATTYHFEYGTSTAYGQVTPDASAGVDNSEHPESAAVSGLQPLSTYHFRVVATSPGGTSIGADQIFTTTGLAPTALTTEAKGVTQTTATITGTVNPRGLATTYRFDYGTNTAYAATASKPGTSFTATAATPTQSAGSGTADQGVSAALSGLRPSTTYHYRVLAISAAGTTSGGDRTFLTPAVPLVPPPTPSTLKIGSLPSGCAPARFTVPIRVTSSTPLRSVRVLLDNRVIGTTTRSVFAVRIVTSRLRQPSPPRRRAQRLLAGGDPLRTLPRLPRRAPTPPATGAPALHRLAPARRSR